MRFTITAAALAALVATAFAQTADFDAITKPLKDEKVPAGKDYEITWDLTPKYTGGVTLSLLGGATPATLLALGDIGTADNADGKFTWSVDKSLGADATYGIQITLDSDTSIFQYSFPFHITGGSPGGSSSSSGSASGTATYTISSMTSTKITDSTAYPTLTPPSGNYSTTLGPPKTTLTTTKGPTGTTGGQTTPTSGAGARAAGPLAVVGGLVMAALAL